MMNQETITAATAQFLATYRRAFESADETQEYRQFADEISVSGGIVRIPWASEFPQLEKWVTQRTVKRLEASEYVVPVDKFSAAIRVPVEDLEDDKRGLYSHRFESAANAAAEWANGVIYALMAAGDTAPCLDGAPFFGTHEDSSGTVSNVSAGSSSPIYVLDTNRPLKPFVFLNRTEPKMQTLARSETGGVSGYEFMNDELVFGIRARGAGAFGLWQTAYKFADSTFDTDALDAIFAFMMARKNDERSSLGITPNLIVCGGSRRSEVLDLIDKKRSAGGGSNRYHNRLSVIVTPHLV